MGNYGTDMRGRVDIRRGSFTVEATFVVTISIWVVLLVCYIAMYSHDCTALYSLGHSYLDGAFENGDDVSEETLEKELKNYLQSHVMLCNVRRVSVEKKMFSVEAEIGYEANVRVPFVKRLLTGENGKLLSLTHETIQPPQRLWDSEMLEN